MMEFPTADELRCPKSEGAELGARGSMKYSQVSVRNPSA